MWSFAAARLVGQNVDSALDILSSSKETNWHELLDDFIYDYETAEQIAEEEGDEAAREFLRDVNALMHEWPEEIQ